MVRSIAERVVARHGGSVSPGRQWVELHNLGLYDTVWVALVGTLSLADVEALAQSRYRPGDNRRCVRGHEVRVWREDDAELGCSNLSIECVR